MCGLTGFWAPAGGRADELTALAREMAQALVHRGPDDEGQFVDPPAGFGLGFRRLAIVDLTSSGHQPMTSHDGRYVIAFNGEIYNYRDLRAELEGRGVRFRGGSDTEVALEALARWGVEEAVPRLWGMFAMAIWDRAERQLWLVRDRLGKKPLYYGRFGNTWLFGSELNALRSHPAFDADIDRGALRAFLRYGYVPAPASIFSGVHKLPPGSLARLDADGHAFVRPYWRVRDVAEAGVAARADHPGESALSAAVDELEHLLLDAIERRLMSDVPLGAFLSGGVDSSAVVALMQSRSSRPIRTFTIGFCDAGYDETEPAEAVARHLGTDHTTLRVTPAELLAVVPRLPAIYDEPFADCSQIPTTLVSELARRFVTVALSGDGGDEVFGGYNRHVWLEGVTRRLGWLPGAVRQGLGGALATVGASTWDAVYGGLGPLLPARLRQRQPGDKLHKLARVAAEGDDGRAYIQLVSQWPAPERLVPEASEPETWAAGEMEGVTLPTVTDRTMLRDFVGYLPDDILTKVDRASMGVSLEARAPLLDHRVVEWAWRQPLAFKIQNGQGKWLLRKVLYRHVPPALIERPKSGFAPPLDAWLRGPLREWAEALLDPGRLTREGFLVASPVTAAWRRHLQGGREGTRLWPVLMFEAWLEAFTARTPVALAGRSV
ncbi:MAG TPA: asparagine synthase (glutamine-hydrolyzing) [Vicinamibacterales bacterium]